jgi:hypothetical protein
MALDDMPGAPLVIKPAAAESAKASTKFVQSLSRR